MTPSRRLYRHSAHGGLQMAVFRASGAHVQKYAALRVSKNHHFRLAVNGMTTQPDIRVPRH